MLLLGCEGRSSSQLDLNQWRVHHLCLWPSISMEHERERERGREREMWNGGLETERERERESEVIVNDAFGLGNKRGELRLEKKTKSITSLVDEKCLFLVFRFGSFFFLMQRNAF